MANITAYGDTLTITSDITKEEYLKVERFAPEALKLKDEDGNEIFRVIYDPFAKSCSENGIVFHSVNTEGKLFFTTDNVVTGIHEDLDAERAMITDRYASILTKINAVESVIKAVSNDVNGMAESVQSSIHICGESDTAQSSIYTCEESDSVPEEEVTND